MDTKSSESDYESTEENKNMIQPNAIKKGNYINVNGKITKVNEISFSKAGKHGHAKTHLLGMDLFTGKKVESSFPSHQKVEIVQTKRKEATLFDISDEDKLIIKESNGQILANVLLPTDDESLSDIRDGFLRKKTVILTIIECKGRNQIVSFRQK